MIITGSNPKRSSFTVPLHTIKDSRRQTSGTNKTIFWIIETELKRWSWINTCCQWDHPDSTLPFAVWMASSEVDQKFLGFFAASTARENAYLSGMLYKLLGLSVILSKKLIRARKLRRLDPTRETKSLQLYHHILWLSREGLVITEQYVLPMVEAYVELKVLAHKLRASFYHIFVLFHNQPSIHQSGIRSLPHSGSQLHLPNGPSGVENGNGVGRGSPNANRDSITASPPPMIPEGGPVGGTHLYPPGLPAVRPTKIAASFILPTLDYTPVASSCFNDVAQLADSLLPGSHPVRLSVKLEYAAYLFDCLHDSDGCRRLAKQAIADVYNAQEGMDDESFEDAAELVGILGKMVKRGGKTSSAGGSSTPGGGSTPGTQQDGSGTARQRHHNQQQNQPRTPTTRGTPTEVLTLTTHSPAVPPPTMTNPI
ncbi:14-3-3-like protein [Histoplasma capsulatum var. duboisii H88]|uniref:14-3-3-like protein n=1 Tax=Ajellomyces capsulatus (strain H88) TaxID=544711 RepID=A0A8A1LC11_AJEC8|nr:14-3-3-like protein [Histoplasma capsulatum var. duboisii H88]